MHIEHSVQASDPLLRSIFENAQIGISVFSIDGREAFFDRASGTACYADLERGKRERDECEQRYTRRGGRTVLPSARFTEEVLQSSERTFRSTVENSRIAIRLYGGAGLVSDPSTFGGC